MDPHVVEARHPGVVVHVPARAREERLTLAEVRTPVAIPTLRKGDLARVEARTLCGSDVPSAFGYWRSGRFARHDGGVWRGMEGRDRKGNLNPVLVPHLDAYLARDPEARLDLDDAFRGTPLAAWGLGRTNDLVEPVRPSPRGEPVDVDASRSIRRDDRARAGLAAAAHLGRRFLIAGDEVWERIAPVLYLTDFGYSSHGQGGIVSGRRLKPARTLYASQGSRAAAEAHRGFGAPDMYAAEIEAWSGLGIDAETDPLPPRAALDGLAGVARLGLDRVLAEMAPDGDREGVSRLRETLRSLELDALCGVAEGEDPTPGLRAVADALDAAVAVRPFYMGDFNASFTLSDLRGYHIPQSERAFAQVVARDVADEDIESLSMAGRP